MASAETTPARHVIRLHHIAIVVQDLDASIEWYRRHLGFDHQYDYVLPGSRASLMVLGDARLEFIQADGAAPLLRERQDVATTLMAGGVNHVALGVDDVDGVVAELTAAGVEIAIPPTDVPNGSGDRFAFIRDNERMLVEIFQARS